jgi:hypothetical protein
LVSAFEELGSLAYGSPRTYNTMMYEDPPAVARRLRKLARQAKEGG